MCSAARLLHNSSHGVAALADLATMGRAADITTALHQGVEECLALLLADVARVGAAVRSTVVDLEGNTTGEVAVVGAVRDVGVHRLAEAGDVWDRVSCCLVREGMRRDLPRARVVYVTCGEPP